jgi:tetratricopeptide (TPR) repeat protein
MTLSLCMIVKDEAAQLGKCLQSVGDRVDEIIVVDTGSQDNTGAIAKAAGAKVFDFEWQNDFAAARNYSLDQATGDWVLVLDADETLTAAGQAVVDQVRAGDAIGDSAIETLLLIALTRYEIGAEQAPYSAVTRLFRRRPDIRFNRPYHETVDDAVAAVMAQEPQWQVTMVPEVAIAHTGYQTSAIAQRDKFTRAQTIMEGYFADHTNDAYIANKLGALYGQAGDWEKARPLLQQGLASGTADPLTTYELHYHLGLADRSAKHLTEAEAHYRAALSQPIPEVLKLGAYINLGSLLQGQKKYIEAADLFEQATHIAPDFAVAYYNLGVAQRNRGYLDPAIAAYETAIALQPDYAEAHQNLGVALFKLGQLPESLRSFQRAIALYQHSNPDMAFHLQQSIRDLGITPQ